MDINFRDNTVNFKYFDPTTQVHLLELIAKQLKYDEETQSKFTTALNAFTKLRFEDKVREIDTWIDVMEDIIRNGKQNKEK